MAPITGRDLGTRFSTLVGNPLLLLFWRILCISVTRRNSAYIRYSLVIPVEPYKRLSLYMKTNGWQMSPATEFISKVTAPLFTVFIILISGLGFLGKSFTPR